LLQNRLGGGIHLRPGANRGVEPMSNRSAGEAEAVVPFAPKLNGRSEAGDPLDRAGQAILGLLHQAANTAEANNQKVRELAHQLSAEVRAAEDRIKELENKARYHEDRADRAER
jgi:hypothetical protein